MTCYLGIRKYHFALSLISVATSFGLGHFDAILTSLRAKASNDYYDAHGYPSDNNEHKDKRNRPNKPYNQYKGNGTQINLSPPKAALHCDNCGLNNHNTSECRKPRGSQRASNNDIVCFACNKTGHKRSQCPTNKVTHRAAAMQQVDCERSHRGHGSPTRPHQATQGQIHARVGHWTR